MNILNTEGYKMIFFTENLLREYIEENYSEEMFPQVLKDKAIVNAKQNGVDEILDYATMLQWIHLGELIDCIKSKKFMKVKKNNLKSIGITDLISERNNIMHSREISTEELNIIKTNCENIISLLFDDNYSNKWNEFLNQDIKKYKLPSIYLDYPCGKDFKQLIGRDNDIKELSNRIRLPQPNSIIGIGGLGKTALVLQMIENFMYSPKRPFEKIYFMSFKNTAFENGKIKRFEKVISNYNDLIYKLAHYMEIEISNKSFDEVDNAVWIKLFSERSLLVLDNLETEIMRSNLSEFIGIADKFIRNFDKASRLLITSRFGLGDREIKYPLEAFDINKTKELMEIFYETKSEVIKAIQPKDWEWIHKYSQGNPALIISFCNTLKSTNKKVLDLRLLYETKHSLEYKELNDKKIEFFNFCFENTIDSLTKNSKLFLKSICYICSQINIYEISTEFIFFLIEELNLYKELGEENISISLFENIGLFQRRGSEHYYVNELVVDYLGNLPKNDENNIETLSKYNWYQNIKDIILKINEVLYDDDFTLEHVLSVLYKNKYKNTNDTQCLIKAFFSEPTPENLLLYYKCAEPMDVLKNLNLLDKISVCFKNSNYEKYQEQFLISILDSMIKVRERIKNEELKDFRQIYLLDYFEQLKNRIPKLKENKVSKQVREKICILHNLLGKSELAISFIPKDVMDMPETAFDVYSRLISKWEIDDAKRIGYINICNSILSKNSNFNSAMLSRFYINSSTFYLKSNPAKAFELAKNMDKYHGNTDTLYANYLQSLLIRAEALIKSSNKDKDEIIKYIDKYKSAVKSDRYKSIWPRKKQKLDSSLRYIEKYIERISNFKIHRNIR